MLVAHITITVWSYTMSKFCTNWSYSQGTRAATYETDCDTDKFPAKIIMSDNPSAVLLHCIKSIVFCLLDHESV